MTKSRNLIAKRKLWTPADDRLLRDMYPNCTAASVAVVLNRTTASVFQAVARLGLQKSPEFFASSASGRIERVHQHPRMIVSRFKPGQTPWNKGLHFAPGGRSEVTRFKPGNKPSKTQPLGSYRLVPEKSGRVHLEQKTSELKGANHLRWTPVSRLVWEAAHGPVPTGHMVIFRKGAHTARLEEITLERLECISRSEHAIRNHPRHLGPEMAELSQLKGAITRQVNRIHKEAQERVSK